MFQIHGVLLLCAFIIQVYSMETVTGFDNSTESEEEVRFLLNGIVNQCREKLNRVSVVLPAVRVTLTRLSNNRLYFFSAPVIDAVNFDSANKFCKDHGMNLVTINSEMENILVHSEAVARSLSGGGPIAIGAWIGLRDISGTSSYRWILNGKITNFNFFGVLPGPGLCGSYTSNVAAPSASWLAIACNTPLAFICELEPPCGLVL